MTWQEYQEAVGELYEQMEGIGTVRKNITLPDKVTKQARQIDTWIEIKSKGHKLGILVDAKFRKDKVDVKDVEEVLALANAVGANMSVLVALNGWTEPAEVKAKFVGLDLKLFTLEEALEHIVPDKWMMCPSCSEECIVADSGGMVVDGLWQLAVVGQCRGCKAGLVWCWDCGDNVIVDLKNDHECGCGHVWRSTTEGVCVQQSGSNQWTMFAEGYTSIEEFSLAFPEPDKPSINDVNFYVCRGIAFRDRCQGNEALDSFNKVIELDPASPVGYFQRAQIFDMANHAEEAIQDYSKAIELDPSIAIAFGSRAGVYYSLERYSEALADFKHFLQLMPDCPDEQVINAAIAHAEFEIEQQKS